MMLARLRCVMLTMSIALAGVSIIADVTTRLEAKGHLGELVIGVVHEFPWRQGGQITINETTKVTVVRLHNAVVVMPWVMLAAHVLFVLLSLGVFIRDTSIEVAVAYWLSCLALLIVQLAGKIVVALGVYTIFNDVTRPDLTSGNKAYIYFQSLNTLYELYSVYRPELADHRAIGGSRGSHTLHLLGEEKTLRLVGLCNVITRNRLSSLFI